MGSAATVCYKRLASLIAQKRDQPYSRTMAWVRCSLSFARLRSSIQCIRGEQNRHVIFLALVALKLLVSLMSRLVACSPRIVVDRQTDRQTDKQTDKQTDTQNDYCNPRCACAPRVNKNNNNYCHIASVTNEPRSYQCLLQEVALAI